MLRMGFLLNAGDARTACCGHHGTHKDLREAFWGQSASVTISLQQGYPFWHANIAIKQHLIMAAYNLNGCRDMAGQ